MPDHRDEFDHRAVPPVDSPEARTEAPSEEEFMDAEGIAPPRSGEQDPGPEQTKRETVGTVADSGLPKEFDPRYRDKLNGLLFLGYLESEFWWMGHHFVMRTVNADDVLAIALLHQQWHGTIGDVKAYQRAVVAAALVSVDGEPLPEPLGPKAESSHLKPRFDYVGQWYPSTIDALYTRYLELEADVADVMTRMGEA